MSISKSCVCVLSPRERRSGRGATASCELASMVFFRVASYRYSYVGNVLWPDVALLMLFEWIDGMRQKCPKKTPGGRQRADDGWVFSLVEEGSLVVVKW